VVAGRRALFGIESKIAGRGGQGQRNTVIDNGAIRPSLHQRGNVDEHELFRLGNGHRVAGGGGNSKRRRIVEGQRVLGPRGIHLIHIEAAVGGDRVHEEAQRCLVDARIRWQSAQIETDVSVVGTWL